LPDGCRTRLHGPTEAACQEMLRARGPMDWPCLSLPQAENGVETLPRIWRNGGRRGAWSDQNCNTADLRREGGEIPPAEGMETEGLWTLSGRGRGARPDHRGRQVCVGAPGLAAPAAPTPIKAVPDIGLGAQGIRPLLRVDTREPRAR